MHLNICRKKVITQYANQNITLPNKTYIIYTYLCDIKLFNYTFDININIIMCRRMFERVLIFQ